ncbi:hypothetical protein LINPERHAP2_LOCUS3137, partial [Linum perenne]
MASSPPCSVISAAVLELLDFLFWLFLFFFLGCYFGLETKKTGSNLGKVSLFWVFSALE